jgi:hypothetical protein
LNASKFINAKKRRECADLAAAAAKSTTFLPIEKSKLTNLIMLNDY